MSTLEKMLEKLPQLRDHLWGEVSNERKEEALRLPLAVLRRRVMRGRAIMNKTPMDAKIHSNRDY